MIIIKRGRIGQGNGLAICGDRKHAHIIIGVIGIGSKRKGVGTAIDQTVMPGVIIFKL